MIASMTGYGKGRAEVAGIVLTVEIKAVNHRYGDITIKSPRFLFPFESEIKKRIAEFLKRGKIDVFISQDAANEKGVIPVLNRPLAGAYMAIFEEMRNVFSLSGDVSVSLLASQKDVVTIGENELDENHLRHCLGQALNQALEGIRQMRLLEGEATLKDIRDRVVLLEELLNQVATRAPEVAIEWRDKLEMRLAKLRTDFDYDPQRVAQELAIFADRCDISEEITRFKSHVEQFRGLFKQTEPVGRKMDFLVQELNREANTMGSKSNDADLTRLVVGIKAELEKIREQVQNIE